MRRTEFDPPPSRNWPATYRAWALVAVALVGIVASVLLARGFLIRERALFEIEMRDRSGERVRAIENQLKSAVSSVDSIVALFAASRVVEPDEFTAFAEVSGHDGIQALGYNPVVWHADRAAHEAKHGVITEKGPDGPVRARDREWYCTVQYIDPRTDNEEAIGFDIASDPTRLAALRKAVETWDPAMTSPVRLVQESGEQLGVLICIPIAENPRGPTKLRDAAFPPSHLAGFAVGVLRIGDMVNAALGHLNATGIHLRLTDETEQPVWLHDHWSRTLVGSVPEIAEDAFEEFPAFPLEIGQRRWLVRCASTPAFRASRSTWIPGGVLALGFFLTCCLVAYFAWQTAVRDRLRHAVAQRNRATEREVRFGRMLEESHDEIYVFDTDTLHFVHVNRGARNNLGYTMAELRAMTPLDLNTALTEEEFAELVRPLRDRQRDRISFQAIHERKNGSKYDTDVHLQLSTFDDKQVFVAMILDITERKHLELKSRQSQRVEALGTLAGGIAHDMNNLLTGIMGHTELCMEDARNGASVESRLGEIMRASERARDVVRRVLTFSSRHPIEVRPVELRETLSEVLRLVRASIPSQITIREQLDATCVVEGDATQIHQVVLNLCTNAAYAMRQQGGDLRVGLSLVPVGAEQGEKLGGMEPGPYAVISVHDDGEGIPPEALDRIFDPFFTTKPQGEGTGMGLSVVHGIVKSHGGAITVQNEDVGTRFDVYLPAAESELSSAEEVPSTGESRGERILLVDDETSIVQLLSNMLSRAGYVVESFTDGDEALTRFRQDATRFDLVITDLTMPRTNGLTVARNVRSSAPDTPVILISGYGDLVDQHELEVSGVRMLINKPLRLRELLESVRNLLDRVDSVRPGSRG